MLLLEKIPFSYLWLLKNAIGPNVNSILDLGCSRGYLMKLLSANESWNITGVEINAKAAKLAQKTHIYKYIYTNSITKLPAKVVNNKFDVVFSSQVVEHINKKEVLTAIKTWENLAIKKIVITTIVGFFNYEPLEKHLDKKEPFQKHLSAWYPEDFKRLNYTVRGQGIRFIYGTNGLIRKNTSLISFWSIIGLLCAPIPYFWPKFGTYMVCTKNK